MKLLKGPLSYSRFTLPQGGLQIVIKSPDADPDALPLIGPLTPAFAVEALIQRGFQPFPDEWSDASMRVGWCEAGDPFEPPTMDALLDAKFLVVGMRTDKFVVPAGVLKREVKREAKRQCALGRDRLSPRELKSLKAFIAAELRKKIGPTSSDVEIVWSLEERTVRLFGRGDESFMELFKETTGITLKPVEIELAEDMCEFLLWLWVNAECNPAGADYALEREVRFDSTFGSAKFTGQNPGLRDARTSLAIGRAPAALTLGMRIECEVPFDAHVALTPTGIKSVEFSGMPGKDDADAEESAAEKQTTDALSKVGIAMGARESKPATEEPAVKTSKAERDEATLLLRMDALARVERRIDALYAAFRRLYDDPRSWSRVRAAIDLWVASDAGADKAYAQAIEVDV